MVRARERRPWDGFDGAASSELALTLSNALATLHAPSHDAAAHAAHYAEMHAAAVADHMGADSPDAAVAANAVLVASSFVSCAAVLEDLRAAASLRQEGVTACRRRLEHAIARARSMTADVQRACDLATAPCSHERRDCARLLDLTREQLGATEAAWRAIHEARLRRLCNPASGDRDPAFMNRTCADLMTPDET